MSADQRETGHSVLPLYIVCDEGGSMAGEAIESVNNGIVEIMESIADDPVVDARIRISIIAFNDSAQVLMDLRQTSEVTDLPQCVAEGSSSYLSAFKTLKRQIENDVPKLRADGFQVHRPAVFFVSRGKPHPGENWQAEHAALVDAAFKYRPNILSFGVGDADPAVMLSIATAPRGMNKPMAFKGKDGHAPWAVLREILKVFLVALVAGKRAVDFSQAPAGSEFIIGAKDGDGHAKNTGNAAGAPTEGALSVVPFYIVCDEGGSMAGEPIESVNKGIVEIMESIADDPMVDSKARISIIAFNDSAQVLMDLRQTSEATDLPQCVARGSSSYLSAFRALKERIEIDTLRLKTEGFHVLQPYVFFISCGRPNPGENWKDVRAALVGASFPYRPNILSFGVGDADPAVMLSIATTPTGMNIPMAFKGLDGLAPGSALREIMKFNLHS